MNLQQFKAFIQEQNILDAYNLTPIDDPEDWFGPGWYDLTAQLITDLIALGWDKQLCQAKEKFGGGRFYIGKSTKEMLERLLQWQSATFKTCEYCGTTDNVTTSGEWLKTLCNNCRRPIQNHET